MPKASVKSIPVYVTKLTERSVPFADMTISTLRDRETGEKMGDVSVNPGGVYVRFLDEDGSVDRIFHFSPQDLTNAILQHY